MFRRLALLALLAAAPAPKVVAPSAALLPGDFPDPFLLRWRGKAIAYATNAGGRNVQLAISNDLRRWRRLNRDALPRLPGWAAEGFTWAPEVIALGDVYHLYFTARERASGRQCIGVARAAGPLGPFVSTAKAPLVCQRQEGGTIDASPFRDAGGALFLLFKNDGNRIGAPSRLYAARLRADGQALAGAPVALLANDRPWQGAVIEAPTLVRRHGYWLFFSGGDYGWPRGAPASPYAIGVARCAGPLGPCTPAPRPILASRTAPCLSGPGHQAVLRWHGRDYLAFHAWDARPGCKRGAPVRRLHLARLDWK